MTINEGSFLSHECPEDAVLVLVDPPYGLGKRYATTDDKIPFEEWVKRLVTWNKAPWLLILGPHPTMYDWLAKVPKPERIIYWHRTFVLPRRGLKRWTESLTPILVYTKPEAVWYGKIGSHRDQHDSIDAHSMMGDVSRLKKLGVVCKPHNPGATGTALPSKLIPFLTKPGDLVVDPMCGTGGILVAAQRLGRRVWGCEIAPTYRDAARAWLMAEGPCP